MYKRIKKMIFGYIPTVIKTGILFKIPSLYDMLEIKPTSCTIMLTNRCNSRCVMCRQWRETPSTELSTADWKRVINDLKANGINNIHFSGGEPFLRQDLSELVSHSSSNGFVAGLTTNGLLLKEEALERLVDLGLRSIAISIDSLDKGYEEIRGVPDSFARAAAGFIAKVKSKRKIDAYINFTLMKGNVGDFRKVKTFADGIGLPVAICLLDKNSSIFDVEENRANFWISRDEDVAGLQGLLNFLRIEKSKKPRTLLLNYPMIDFMGAYFREPRQAHIPCVSSQDRVIIDPYGNLLNGCLSMGSFGNLKDTPFGILHKDDRYKKAKRNMFYKRCAGCSCGYQFNIKNFPAAIARDALERIKALAFSER